MLSNVATDNPIEEFPIDESATPVIEEFPAESSAGGIEEFPDSTPLLPEQAREAYNATMGAIQALDVMGLPFQFDWSDTPASIRAKADAAVQGQREKAEGLIARDRLAQKGVNVRFVTGDPAKGIAPGITIQGDGLINPENQADVAAAIKAAKADEADWKFQQSRAASEQEEFKRALAEGRRFPTEQEWLEKRYQDHPDERPGAISAAASQMTGGLLQQGASIARSFQPSGQTATDIAQWMADEGAAAKGMAQAAGQGTAAQVGRGAGSFGSLFLGTPPGMVGLASSVLRGAGEASEDVYAQGGTPGEAQQAKLSTIPALAAYIFGGHLAGRMASGALPATAGAVTRAAVGGGANLASNVAIGSGIRAYEGQDWMPTAENLTMDALFALAGGKHIYQEQAPIQRAREQAKSEQTAYEGHTQQIRAQQEQQRQAQAAYQERASIPITAEPTSQTRLSGVQGENRVTTLPDVTPAATPEAVAAEPAKAEVPVPPTAEAPAVEVAPVAETPTPKVEAKVLPEDSLPETVVSEPAVEPPREATKDTPQARITSIKNETVDRERARRGLAPAMEAGKRTFQEAWDDAMREIEADPANAQNLLIAELDRKPRALTDKEDAMLLHRQIELQNAFDKAADQVNKAFETGDSLMGENAQARMDAITKELVRIYDVGKRAGTETGRGLNARKMLAAQDFTLARMMAREQASQGGVPLSREEKATITKEFETISKNEKALEEKQAETDQKNAESAVDSVVQSEASKITPLVERITTYLDQRADAARKRLAARMRSQSQDLQAGGMSKAAGIAADLLDLATSQIAKKTVQFADWATEMVKEFGEGIRPFLQNAWDSATGNLDRAIIRMAKEGERKTVKKGVKAKADAAGQIFNADKAIGELIADGIGKPQLQSYIDKLTNGFIRQGIKEREPLIDAVHGVLSRHFPEQTRSETMAQISNFGKFTPLSTEPVRVTRRDLNGQIQQLLKLEKIRAGEPVPKTGMERRTKSNEERRLETEVNNAKKQYGVTVTDPKTQLKSAQDAAVTRLKNEVVDLTHELEFGPRSPKEPLMLPEEAQLLKGIRDRVRETLRSIQGDKTLTEEQRTKMAENTLERLAEYYEGRVRNRETAAPAKRSYKPSARTEEFKARIESLKAQLEEIRASDSYAKEDAKAEALVKQIERAEAEIAGFRPSGGKEQTADSQIVAEAKAQLAGLRKTLSNRRASDPKRIADRQEAAERALEKSISELDRRIQEEDFNARKLNVTPDSPKMERLKSERAAMRKIYMELKDAGRIKLTPEEVSMKALMSRLTRQKAEMESAHAAGTFVPPKKRTPIDLSKNPEAVRLQSEVNKLKSENAARIRANERAQWSKGRRAWEAANAAYDTHKQLVASFDLSAPRQGAVAFLSHPVLGFRSMGKMIKAAGNEDTARDINASISLRDNAKNGKYEQAELAITPYGEDTKFSAREENLGAHYASLIPGVKASERGFQTFLNVLRADVFDKLLASAPRELTRSELKEIGSLVNIMTGRGDFGRGNGSLSAVSKIIWAPRLLQSRIQWLSGVKAWQRWGNATPLTRRIAQKEIARFIGGVSAMYALTQLYRSISGDDEIRIGTDWRSSDVGKIIVGNTRIDPLGGLSQVLSLIGRMKTGETVGIDEYADPVDLSDESARRRNKTRWNVLTDFARSKFAPGFGTAIDIATQTRYGNREFEAKDLWQDVLPLPLREVFAQGEDSDEHFLNPQMKDDTAKWIRNQLLNFFGIGARSYDRFQ
jgi:hypothetical protein